MSQTRNKFELARAVHDGWHQAPGNVTGETLSFGLHPILFKRDGTLTLIGEAAHEKRTKTRCA